VPKTLLAVDDSVTMRKVIEMTFAGEDIKVRTVASAQDALSACRKERPDIVLADVALDGHSGYDLCRSIKDEFQGVPVVVISSKQNPFDPARGQAAGCDEHIDKPYDTAKAIELVKKVLAQGKSVAPAPIAAAVAPAAPAAPRSPMFAPAAPAVASPQPPPVMPKGPPPAPHATAPGMPAANQRPALQRQPSPALGRQTTASFDEPKPAVARIPTPPPARAITPALRPQTTAVMPSDAPPARAARLEVSMPSTGGNGGVALPADVAGKLSDIGLTPAQVDAVLALSREVVERVVWEVVPVLAETLVKEEIARLTREG